MTDGHPDGGRPHEVVDPGLQGERTRLSWSRTALGFCATGGLLVHAGRVGSGASGMTLGLVVFAFGVAMFLWGRARYRATAAAIRAGGTVAAPVPLLVVCVFATLTAVFALVTLGL